MSSTSGEPASAGEITEVQEGAADDSDKSTTAQKTPEVEKALHAISDKLFLITEHGETIGSGAEAKIVTAEYQGRRLALKIHKHIESLPPEERWDDKVFNIIAPHVCSAVGYSTVHDGEGSIAWVMPRHLLNLRELIDSKRRKPPFPYATAVDLIVQLALGMRALHKREIMHRDIRAANVLVTAIASPKFHSIAIADFGGGTNVVGAGFWRAPEILAVQNTPIPEIPYTFACDVYSFAITCYEILTGELPFPGEKWSNYGIVLSGNRPPLPDHLPHEITRLIHQCWLENASLRPNAAEILDLLRNILLHNPDLKPILWRLDLADIWSGEETDTPPPAAVLQSLHGDLKLLKNQGKTEAARLGEEFIALYQSYVAEFTLVSVWKLPRFWEKVPAVLGIINKGNEFVNSLPDHGPNTVRTLKTYSRLVRPIVFVKFGFGPIAQTFVRRYSDVLVAFVNKNGGEDTFRILSEHFKAVGEQLWASERMCRVRYHWGRFVRTLKRWFGVRDSSQAQVQGLLDKGLLTGDYKAS